MEAYYPDYVGFPAWTYHQFVGRKIAEIAFGIEDEDILAAIEFHASGNKGMGKYAKVVYACDKIDPFRGYDSLYMIKAMEEDLDEGFAFVLKENRDYLQKKGYKVDNPFTEDCFRFYLR